MERRRSVSVVAFLVGFAPLWGAACTPDPGDGVNGEISPDTTREASFASPQGPSLLERLGYPPDTRLLIVHSDDIGLAHSANRAMVDALATGQVNSGSVMVPCPWFPDIAAYARDNLGADLGVHITLTSEWNHYRWGPVLPASVVPSLVDSLGFLFRTSGEAARRMDPAEAEAEMSAQVERALAFGMRPTHLDSHMGSVFRTPELFAAYLRVGREFDLPVLVPSYRELGPEFLSLMTAEDLTVDYAVIASPEVPAEGWADFYTDAVRALKPGVTVMLMHLAFDDEEMQRITLDHPDFDSAWRQRDFDFFTSPGFGQLLEEVGVELITWREIGNLLDRQTQGS